MKTFKQLYDNINSEVIYFEEMSAETLFSLLEEEIPEDIQLYAVYNLFERGLIDLSEEDFYELYEAVALSAPSSTAVSKKKTKSGGTRKMLPGTKTSTPRLSGPSATVSKSAPAYQTLARGVAPVSSMVSGSGEFEKGTKMSGKSKLSDRLSSVRKSVESGAARGTAIGAMSGLPRTAMVSGILGGVSGGVSNAFGQLAQQKGEKIENGINKAVSSSERAKRDIKQNTQRTAELKSLGKERVGLNKSMDMNTRLDTTKDKLNTVFGRQEQKPIAEVPKRNLGSNASKPGDSSKPAPKPIEKIPAQKSVTKKNAKPTERKSLPTTKPSSSEMDDLRASVQKMRSATSDLAQKTGEWKSLQKPQQNSSLSSQMKSVASSEPSVGRKAFPSSAKYPNQSVFSSVAGK